MEEKEIVRLIMTFSGLSEKEYDLKKKSIKAYSKGLEMEIQCWIEHFFGITDEVRKSFYCESGKIRRKGN